MSVFFSYAEETRQGVDPDRKRSKVCASCRRTPGTTKESLLSVVRERFISTSHFKTHYYYCIYITSFEERLVCVFVFLCVSF